MPPLNNRLGNSPRGFGAQEQPEALPKSGRVSGANPFIRCPLPPFNASPDTLKQFEENGKVPARRVIPLPIQTQAGGNVTVVNNTSVTNTGSSTTSTGTTSVASLTVTLNCPTMNPGDVFQATLTVAKVAVLLIATASDPCEIRIYGDPITQISDAGRAIDNAPPYEVTPGLVSDVVFDSSPYIFNWQNRVFANQDTPVTTNLYITVLNPATGSVITPSVTVTYLTLE